MCRGGTIFEWHPMEIIPKLELSVHKQMLSGFTYQFRVAGLSLLFLFSSALILEAQRTIQPKQIDFSSRGVLYKEEVAFDLQLHTNGISFALNLGDIRKYYLTRYYYLGFGILKHPQEYRQPVNFQSGNILIKTSSAFAYGKQNNFMVFRAGLGEKRYFSEKAKRKGVAVGVSYEGGVSIGVLKPYYLNLSRLEQNGVTDFVSTEKYSEDNADIFLDINRIYGSANFFKGIDEVSFLPGLHGKAGMHFSLGAFDEFVRALEAGIMVDIYFRRVPILITERNNYAFLNAYLTVQLGKRK